MAYSKDFKECAVNYKLDNHTYEEVYEIFKIAKSTLYKREKEYAAGFPDKPKRTCEKKINKEGLKKALEDKPDSYLAELAEPFNCSVQAVFYALESMKITQKKTFTYSEKSEEERGKYLEKLEQIPEDQRVYIDESGCNEHYQRDYARELSGMKVEYLKRGRKFGRTNVIAAYCNNEIWVGKTYKINTNSQFFEDWFEFDLLSIIPCGYTIIMDRASFHRKKKLFDIAERYRVNLLFLPAYSPDFNPIEKFWATMKKWLRNNIQKYTSVSLAIWKYLVRFLN